MTMKRFFLVIALLTATSVRTTLGQLLYNATIHEASIYRFSFANGDDFQMGVGSLGRLISRDDCPPDQDTQCPGEFAICTPIADERS